MTPPPFVVLIKEMQLSEKGKMVESGKLFLINQNPVRISFLQLHFHDYRDDGGNRLTHSPQCIWLHVFP